MDNMTIIAVVSIITAGLTIALGASARRSAKDVPSRPR